jgi:hypothetical protein
MGAGKGTEEENASACLAVSVITWYAIVHSIIGNDKLNDLISTGLLASGFMALEKLFPGIRKECEAVDIWYYNLGNDYIAMLIRILV